MGGAPGDDPARCDAGTSGVRRAYPDVLNQLHGDGNGIRQLSHDQSATSPPRNGMAIPAIAP